MPHDYDLLIKETFLLPSLASDTLYRLRETAVYHALETPGPCEVHEHPEAQIMITFPRASYLATWQTALGAKRQRSLAGAGINVIAPGQPHGFDWHQEDKLISLYLAPAFLTQLAAEMNEPSLQEIEPQFGVKNPLIQQAGLDLWRAFSRDTIPIPLYVESVATVLAVHLLRQQDARVSLVQDSIGGLSPRHLRSIREYIEANFHHDLTLQEMAESVGLQRHHFAHAFKQSTGISPYQYVLCRRMEHAVKLLTTTRLTIGEIAHLVGFHDSGQFSRQFKRIVGATPRSRRDSSR